MSAPVLAWHFLAADRRMAHQDEVVEAGYVYTYDGPLKLRGAGFHASVRAVDAIQYAPGPVVCRVRCSGEIIHNKDKLVAQHREVLWMADATSVLRLIACECVRKTPLGNGRVVWDLLTDPRSREVVEVAERYAHGKATDKELAAARDAASAAARDAAWDAAWAGASDFQNVIATRMLMKLAPKLAKQ